MRNDIRLFALNISHLYNIISPYFDNEVQRNDIIEQIKQFIMPKLQIFNKSYCCVESEYVETEWKDMISLHYINTSYLLRNTVIRIHVFKKNEYSSKNYMGFFTLRPIDEIKVMMSFIYPNWDNITSKSYNSYIMTYEKQVHIFGELFTISTYPLFCQDAVVTSCAHANIISMSKYLYNKCGMPKVRLLDLKNSYIFEESKMYPTTGLGFKQMLNSLHNIGLRVLYDSIPNNINKSEKYNEYYNKKIKLIRDNIDIWIESALPVLLSITFRYKKNDEYEFAHHILQIVGHTDEGVKRYLIYDDSGVFANELGLRRNFLITLSWDEIEDKLFNYNGYVIYPQYEKVYIAYKEVKENLLPILIGEDLNSDIDIDLKNIYNKITDPQFENIRCLLIDNNYIKEFLRENCNVNKDMVNRIIKYNLPHYLWYCEAKILDDLYLVFLANPTYNIQTTKNIFINKEPLVLTKQIGLLTRLC